MDEAACTDLVWERADGRCERCGGWGLVTRHHRKKRSQGGGWTPGNIVLLCGHGTVGCHGWVEHDPARAEKEGYHVRPWNDPEMQAVKMWHGWVVLREDGSVDATPKGGKLPDDVSNKDSGRGSGNVQGSESAVPEGASQNEAQ